jgi:hypothetical protein
MQHQVRQDVKQEQGSNDGSQEYYAKDGETETKLPSNSNTKELESLPDSTEPIIQRTNNELYDLLMKLHRLVQMETSVVRNIISGLRDQLGDDEDDTGERYSGYSDEDSTDSDSQSDDESLLYSEDEDSTEESDSDGYSTDEYKKRSRGRKDVKVASKGRLDAPPRYRGRFPIAVASRKG